MQEHAIHTNTFTGFDFIAHIYFTRAIIAHHDDGECGGAFQTFDSISDFFYEWICQCFDVKNHLSEEINKKRNESCSQEIEDENEDERSEIEHADTSWEYLSREIIEWSCDTIERSYHNLNTNQRQPAEEDIDDDGPIDEPEKKGETSEDVESESNHENCYVKEREIVVEVDRINNNSYYDYFYCYIF